MKTITIDQAEAEGFQVKIGEFVAYWVRDDEQGDMMGAVGNTPEDAEEKTWDDLKAALSEEDYGNAKRDGHISVYKVVADEE